MPGAIFEQMGYILWEGLMLGCVVAGTLAVVVLRRKMNQIPRLIKHDLKSLFRKPPSPLSKPGFCLRFVLAVSLFSCIAVLEVLALAQLGAAILSVSLVVSCASIVNSILL